MPHWVYILYSESLNKYYVGESSDVARRLEFHNNPIESRKFTSRGIPWILKASFAFENKESSMKAERALKKMKSRKFFERLISDPALINSINT